MSKSELSKDILVEIINFLSDGIKEMKGKYFRFSNTTNTFKMEQKFRNINFKQKLIDIDISFETNTLYKYFIIKIYKYLIIKKDIIFNSDYSALYFRKIINYLELLIKSKIDIIEDDLIKIFFYLLFLFFDDKLNIDKIDLDLDETFFKGTFIELTEKYSIEYKDSILIKNIIDEKKLQMIGSFYNLVEVNFQYIKEILDNNSIKEDHIIKKMIEKTNKILFELSKAKNDFSDVIKAIKEFYEIKESLIFTNYISETDREELYTKINEEFLNKEENEKKYSYFKLDDNLSKVFDYNNINDCLGEYKILKNKFYQRMKYSLFHEIINKFDNFDLNNELLIFGLADYNFEDFQKFIIKLENLNQNDIIRIVKEILNENDFYDAYFSILRTDIVKFFFTTILYLDEGDTEFQFKKEKLEGSECFDEIYNNFLKDYDKKKDNYQKLKDVIIFKLLSSSDRAYTIKRIKKIVINPTHFFLGKDINDKNGKKLILKGYLMIILLHETEHFFRLLDKENKNVFPFTPREKEGGRMFIKYLFDVESINHINEKHATKILNIDNWKNHDELKKIFFGELQDIKEDNLDVFIRNKYPNSISFYTRRAKKEEKDNKEGKYPNNIYIRK